MSLCTASSIGRGEIAIVSFPSFISQHNVMRDLFVSSFIFGFSIVNFSDTVVRSSTIPEELGRISFLLSDKTGTLTMNEMRFKKIHLGTVAFSSDAFEVSSGVVFINFMRLFRTYFICVHLCMCSNQRLISFLFTFHISPFFIFAEWWHFISNELPLRACACP